MHFVLVLKAVECRLFLFDLFCIARCEAAYLVKVKSLTKCDSKLIAKKALEAGIKVRPIENEPGAILLSCAGFDTEKTDDMLERLKTSFTAQ